MSEREFQFVKKIVEGRPVSARRIVCDGCGITADYVTSGSGPQSSTVVARWFRQRGWSVGNKPRADQCQACHEQANAERRTRREQITQTKETVMANAAPAKPAAEPPREMGRDDRRVVFAKLNEVYLDETKGYESGWTDVRVAQDLGVPVAWVASVREENFGPARDNEEIRRFLDLVAGVALDSARVEAEFAKLAERKAAIAERVRDLEKLAKSVRVQVGAA